jgi:nucleoside-triphosphatase THEP1
VTLNAGQEAAADGFFEFLFSDQRESIISGPGGVGKTFLMSHLIDEIMPRYFDTCQLMGVKPEYDQVVMTATTNKAAEVLAVATQRPTSTIHSYLGLKVTEDYKTGAQKLEPTRAWQVHQRTILFIDETSMMDTPLLRFVREGMHNCKVVFVGDHCQLAPVMEPISPVYKTEKPFVILTEPMRNNGQPALMEVCNQLRNTVETQQFSPIKIVPGVIDLLDDEGLEREIAVRFTQQNLNTRILAYTNGRVMQFNNYIRGLRNLPDEFTEGEFLVNNTAIQMPSRMLSVEEELTVMKVGNETTIPVQGDVELKVRSYDLQSRIGETFTNVLVPTDRSHFEALLHYYKKQKDWNRFYKLKKTYPDLRPRDAATVHKSQGSTYDTVFIDLANISTCHNSNSVARMLYVAFSRPRNRIFLYGKLADKYGGLAI